MGNSQAKGHAKGRQKKQVHWKAAERPTPPGKPQLVPGAEITPDVVTIRWDKPKSDGGSPVTGYLVEHRRTGSPHWVRATPLLVQVPELTLSGLEPGWRYQFRVTAQNTVGMSDPGEISEPLTVTLQRSVITAPKFTEELHDTTALENEMAEFVVHVIGQPPPKICWFKDGFEIFSSRRTRIITENDKSVLTIHQVALPDEGEIKCTATNKAGHASTKAVVKVEAPPVIRLPRQYEDGLLFELDEVIRLKVSIAGRPQPLVFWSHNGETIQNDDRYEIINTDKSSVLRVGEARRSDRGEYQIRAVNQLGEDSTSFLVTVTDKPKPPATLKVVMSLGKTVTLSWELPEDDGGCKIGNYIVEYYRIGWNVWLKAVTCRQLTTTLSDLIEGSEYKFRVKAESPYGVSDPSEETDVIFIPDPKRGMLAPPPRSRSQPRDAVRETSPVPPKRRSTSSTRHSNREQASSLIPSNLAPTPPKREKLKNQRTPEHSPPSHRKDLSGAGINQNMLDRSSLAREITYGTDLKYKKTQTLEPKPVETSDQKNKLPSPIIQRERSPSIINQLLSNILPKKSPSPSPSPSPPAENHFPKVTPEPSPVVERKEPYVPSMKGDRLDRLSPNIINRRSSSPMIMDQREKSPSPGNMNARERSPSIVEDMFGRNRFDRSKSPSPNPQMNRSPSPSRYAVGSSEDSSRRGSYQNDNLSRRDSMKSYHNNNDMAHGSSEFMLVLLEDHDDPSQEYMIFEDSLIAPPMSLSAPELGAESELFMPLKTSASSSELLHERAFARFIKDAEEANRKLTPESASVIRRSSFEKNVKPKITEIDERRPSIPKILINSKDNEDIVGLERKSSFSRRLSTGATNIAQHFWAKRRHSLRNAGDNSDLYDIKSKFAEKIKDITTERSISEEKEVEEFNKVRAKLADNEKLNNRPEPIRNVQEENVYSEEEEDDSDDERLKADLIPPNVEVQEEEIYHPRMMIPTSVSKYEEPFEILTKPLPLPDPNFAPKPILKRKDQEPTKKPTPEKPVRKFLRNEPFHDSQSRLSTSGSERSRTPSPSRDATANQPAPVITRSIPETQMISAAEAAKTKRNLNRQSSEEEYKVVADHYMDIVREYGGNKKPSSFHSNWRELKSNSDDDDNTKEIEKEQVVTRRDPSPVRQTRIDTPRTIASKRNPSPCPIRRPITVPEPPKPQIDAKPKKLRSRSSSRTRNSGRSVTPTTLKNKLNMIVNQTTSSTPRTPSPRPLTPEMEAMQQEAEIKVRSAVDYMTDVAMFIVACWLYLFKDARLAIPILIVMVYRQLKDEVKNMMPAWLVKKKNT